MARKSILLPLLFLIAIPVLVLAAGGFFLYEQYQTKKAALVKAIKELPEFDEETEGQAIADSLDTPYPVPRADRSPQEIMEEVEREVKKIVRKEFPPKEITKKKMAIVKKYSPARVGQKVKFQLRNVRGVITGIYRGKEDRKSAGIFILLDDGVRDNKPYSHKQIMPEFYYLFNENDSQIVTKRELAVLEDEVEAKRDAFSEKAQEKVEEKLFVPDGYRWENDKWTHQKVKYDRLMAKERKKFAKSRKKEIQELKRSHRFLGLFDISIPKPAPVDQD